MISVLIAMYQEASVKAMASAETEFGVQSAKRIMTIPIPQNLDGTQSTAENSSARVGTLCLTKHHWLVSCRNGGRNNE
jgi:hypothetical protein